MRIVINGKVHWLWRAVDQNNQTLDTVVQNRRDKPAAKRFFKKLLKGLRYGACRHCRHGHGSLPAARRAHGDGARPRGAGGGLLARQCRYRSARQRLSPRQRRHSSRDPAHAERPRSAGTDRVACIGCVISLAPAFRCGGTPAAGTAQCPRPRCAAAQCA
ncbi:MAG: DDE-type integrase/transposase/recombinase [Gammaproteobacteria bacterium]|nr:DDE-type integrase/transposase/recombinase [Gammaproteobacteria bacterium]